MKTKVQRLKHRSKHEFLMELLQLVRDNPMLTKTEMLDKANIQRIPLINYIDILLKNELVIDAYEPDSSTSSPYQRAKLVITEKGDNCLSQWEVFKSFVQS